MAVHSKIILIHLLRGGGGVRAYWVERATSLQEVKVSISDLVVCPLLVVSVTI